MVQESASLFPPRDVLHHETPALDAIFHPRTVAIVGATDRPGSVARTVIENLRQGFRGRLYAVNPARREALGLACYPTVTEIPEKLDLAVIVTPAATVPGVIAECVRAAVGGAVVISAGFKERGEQGKALEREIQQYLRGSRLRVIGPNCLGVMNPPEGFNATFAAAIARPGKVAFLSQSGALLTAVLDWSLREMVGFSAFVSTGSMLDVNWGDLIYYFGDDPRTESILIYMESAGEARSFLSAAREVALTKPIIVIKAGRTAAAAQAAASHTGALTGSDEVLEAAFRRCGVLRVSSIADVFYMAEVLSKQPRPRGPRLTIITNAGGPGVLATDALIAGGGELAAVSPSTLAELNQILPAHWSHGNPIDILGDAEPERYAAALRLAAADPSSDGLLLVMAPQGMTDPARAADAVAPFAHSTGKPVLASWMGGAGVAAGVEVLNHAGIPTFDFPDSAARAFNYMWRYSYNLKGLYETPELAGADPESRAAAAGLIQSARAAGRTLLTEPESQALLAAYGIPVVPTRVAATPDEAVACARAFGFPVVLKLYSRILTHKTDVGGVQLNLRDEAGVRAAWRRIEQGATAKAGAAAFQGVAVQPMVRAEGYELILGSSLDAQFGPVILFGSGGQLVEVYRDHALALPPLNTTLARRLMEQTRVYAALQGVRGRKPVDLEALERVLVQFSQLVVEQPWIKEMDINPLLASPSGLLALDARVVLHGPEAREEELPRSAIRPYPSRYSSPWRLRNGTEVVIRPIRPEDEPLMAKFHQTLSARSVYLRYGEPSSLSARTTHERLTRICFVDYDREIALVAEHTEPATRERAILAVGRLSKLHGSNEARFAILVGDPYQRQGLGTELLRRLLAIGRDERLERISAAILPENREIQTVARRLGYQLHFGEGMVTATIELSA